MLFFLEPSSARGVAPLRKTKAPHSANCTLVRLAPLRRGLFFQFKHCPDPPLSNRRAGTCHDAFCWARVVTERTTPPRRGDNVPAGRRLPQRIPLSPSAMAETTLSKKSGLLMMKLHSSLSHFI